MASPEPGLGRPAAGYAARRPCPTDPSSAASPPYFARSAAELNFGSEMGM
jgi:hypothetical protein